MDDELRRTLKLAGVLNEYSVSKTSPDMDEYYDDSEIEDTNYNGENTFLVGVYLRVKVFFANDDEADDYYYAAMDDDGYGYVDFQQDDVNGMKYVVENINIAIDVNIPSLNEANIIKTDREGDAAAIVEQILSNRYDNYELAAGPKFYVNSDAGSANDDEYGDRLTDYSTIDGLTVDHGRG
jgi:hypothetical protein